MSRAAQRSDQRLPVRPVIRTALNRYDLDESRIPEGMTYEWKAKTIKGQENVEGLINYEANGWVPVPPDRHPELTGRSGVGGEIVRGGLVLMERPQEITEAVQQMVDFNTRRQTADQLKRLGQEGKRAGGKGLSRGYEPAPESGI